MTKSFLESGTCRGLSGFCVWSALFITGYQIFQYLRFVHPFFKFFFLLHDEIYAILCILDGVIKQKVLKVGIKSSN